jgi:hypothetical protein
MCTASVMFHINVRKQCMFIYSFVFSSHPFATSNYIYVYVEKERMPLGACTLSPHNESALVGGLAAWMCYWGMVRREREKKVEPFTLPSFLLQFEWQRQNDKNDLPVTWSFFFVSRRRLAVVYVCTYTIMFLLYRRKKCSHGRHGAVYLLFIEREREKRRKENKKRTADLSRPSSISSLSRFLYSFIFVEHFFTFLRDATFFLT